MSTLVSKVAQQLIFPTEQRVKETKEAKKAKKAEAMAIAESPEETAAFLATVKGLSQPSKTVCYLSRWSLYCAMN